ncbi:hypothetical protein Hanom_Chr06g00494751 [Helianthus anomalus]
MGGGVGFGGGIGASGCRVVVVCGRRWRKKKKVKELENHPWFVGKLRLNE